MASHTIPRSGSGADRWFGIKSQIHSKLINSLTPEQLKSLNKDGVRSQIGNVVERLIADDQIPMTVAELVRFIEAVLDEVVGVCGQSRIL
jgi:pilus assembly protein CpaF